MDQSIATRKPTSFDPHSAATEAGRKVDGFSAGKDAKDDIASAVNGALAEIRHMLDDIAAATRDKRGDVQRAAESLTAAAAEKAEAVAEGARAAGREGLNAVSKTVSDRPLASVAAAAGVGLLLGLVLRGGGRE